ncbi:NifU family protein [Luteirhabdus pelagi]|uniref:NifU family protein n=1 Tax=Luteirhabdus pelagi TaxID=2792783 RepID=UPI00193AD929|nr:NifU family protein [Luteirhabdus pelagi]
MSQYTISIEPTKNEAIVKFVANSFLTRFESFEFKNIDEAKPSPLAQQLFHLPFVKTVYVSQNFIAIEKFSIVEWQDVQEEVKEAIEEYLNSGKSVLAEVQREDKKKVPVTVYAESTPNPIVMKFVANKPLVEGVFEYKDIDEAEHAPLAQALFSFPFVKEVFISANYVSIMKYDVASWEDISLELREFIKSYIEDAKPILTDAALDPSSEQSTPVQQKRENFSSTEKEIEAILEEYVKPAVAGDGGHIALDSFNEETQTARVLLQGACSGCPSSTVTLKNGIETMLKEMMPGRISAVEAING